MNKRHTSILFVSLGIAGILAHLNGCFRKTEPIKKLGHKTVVVYDTIVRHDTLYKKSQPVVVHHWHQGKRELKAWRDTIKMQGLTAVIQDTTSGDSIVGRVITAIATDTCIQKTLYDTVYMATEKKRKRFTLAAAAGYGYGWGAATPAPIVGLVVGIKLFDF